MNMDVNKSNRTSRAWLTGWLTGWITIVCVSILGSRNQDRNVDVLGHPVGDIKQDI